MPSLNSYIKKNLSVSDSDAKSKGYFKTGGSEQPSFFNKMGRDEERLKKWGTIYEQGGLASQCVDAYAYYILSNNFRIEGDNEGLRTKVNDWCKKVNINRALRASIVDSCVYGRYYIEKVYGRGSKSDEIVALKAIDPKTMRPECDIKGNITGYTQIVEIDNKEYKVPFTKDEIWSDSLFPVSGNIYGISLIQRAYDDIMHDAKISESTAEAILRHGFPKYHIRVGAEGDDVDPKVLSGIDQEFRQLKAKSEIATVHDVEISNLDKDAMPNIQDIVSWASTRVCTSMGIPEVCLGFGKGATEATATVQMRMLYDRVSYLQKDIEAILNPDVIDNVSGKEGAAVFVFNDANPQDELEMAEWLSKIMAMTQMNPTYIFPKAYIQEKFGVKPELYPDDSDELYGMNPAFEQDKQGYYDSINATRATKNNPKDAMSPANKKGTPNEDDGEKDKQK